MIGRFNLPLEHPSFTGYATVIVHETVEELRAAATRYSDTRLDDFSDSDAVWHGNICYPTDPCTVDHRFLGVMRLPRNTTVDHVVHECVHAAITAYRLARGHLIVIPPPYYDHRADRDYYDEPEELIAFAVGDLAATCLAGLASLADHGVTVA